MKKEEEFSEWYSWVLKEARLVDLRYGVKGFLVILPNAFSVIKRIYKLYEEALEEDGHLPVKFPVVIPERNLRKEKEHIKGFEEEVFWITHAGKNILEERLALRPTSETAFYPMYALWIKGRKDLPIKLYQSGTVWRYETKATRPFLRVREILWIETHDAFPTLEEAKEQIRKDYEIAKKVIWESLGIPFFFVKRPEWDKFAGAEETYAADTILPDGKVLQIATTHLLGQKFAKAFGIKFMDSDGKEKYVWQTCYGPGISRIYASLLAIHGDDKGLIIPFHLSQTQVVIIPIPKKGKEEIVNEYARKVFEQLKGVRVVVDYGEETPGFKFNQWELLGVPIRIEVGPKEAEENTATVVRRDTREKTYTSLEKLKEKVIEIGEKMFEEMKRRSKEEFDKRIIEVDAFDTLSRAIENGKVVKAPFCSLGMDGYQCYSRIKEELKAEVRGEEFGSHKPQGKECVVCGKEAEHIVFVARQY